MNQFFAFELIIELTIIYFGVKVLYDNYFVSLAYKVESVVNQATFTQVKRDIIERIIFIFYICYFPFIQALGLVFFKDSKDPLSKISKLDYLKIISINQRATKTYKCIKEDEVMKKTIYDLRMESNSSLSS